MVFCNGILYNLGVYLVLKVKMATDHTNISRTLFKVTNFYTHKAFLIVIVGSMLLKIFI